MEKIKEAETVFGLLVFWWGTEQLSELFALDLYATDIINYSWQPLYKNRDFLHSFLAEKRFSPRRIAKRLRCSIGAVRFNTKKLGLEELYRPDRRNASPPYGKNNEHGMLIDNLNEIKIIKRMLELRKDGLAYAKIADYLNKKLVPTKIPGSKWHGSTICKIIKDNKN